MLSRHRSRDLTAVPLKPRNDLPSIEKLRSRLCYEAETGILRWLPRPISDFPNESIWKSWNSRFAGKCAGSRKKSLSRKKGNSTHRQIEMGGKKFYAHRIAWAMANGRCDAEDIDHLNGDQDDNRLNNLRAVSHSENNKNKRLDSRSKTGITGVSLSYASRYVAYIGRATVIGYFPTLAEAVQARKSAEKIAGYHPNHGRMA